MYLPKQIELISFETPKNYVRIDIIDYYHLHYN